jgi:hypothetical protein
MSNLLSGQWGQYYQMPCLPESIERSLSCAAFRYYGLLCREMNRRSATELHYSNADVARGTGIKDHKTLAKARRELHAAGLVNCDRRAPPGVYIHIMLNKSGDRIPPPTGRRGIARYEPRKGSGNTPKPKEMLATAQPRPGAGVNENGTVARCPVHGQAEHWGRNGDVVCERCHPNPNPPVHLLSESSTHLSTFSPPSAKDLGFD